MRAIHPVVKRLGSLPFGIRFTNDGYIAIVPLLNSFQSIDSNEEHVVKCAFLQGKVCFWKMNSSAEFSYGELFCLEDEPLVKEWLQTANVL